jgi:hypothetical protein
MYLFPVLLNGCNIFYLCKLQITFLSKGKTEADELHALRTEAGFTLGSQKTGETIAADLCYKNK